MKATFAPLVIEAGQTESSVLKFNDLRWLRDLEIIGPASLDGTVTVEVTTKRNPESTDWAAQQSGGSDVTVPAGKAIALTRVPFAGLRLVSDAVGGETAKREFQISGRER